MYCKDSELRLSRVWLLDNSNRDFSPFTDILLSFKEGGVFVQRIKMRCNNNLTEHQIK